MKNKGNMYIEKQEWIVFNVATSGAWSVTQHLVSLNASDKRFSKYIDCILLSPYNYPNYIVGRGGVNVTLDTKYCLKGNINSLNKLFYLSKKEYLDNEAISRSK